VTYRLDTAPGVPGPRGAALARRAGIGLVHGLYRPRVLGAWRVPAQGPVILAVNHSHNVDGPLLFGTSPRPLSVTITDGSGTMVWPQGGGAGGDGSLPSKTAAEARYDTQLEGSLNAMLAQTLGAGKATVQVHSDLNVDKTDQQQLQYDKKGTALAEKKTVESLKGSGAGASGAAGSQSNLPGYAANAAGGSSNNNYKNTTTDTQFGVGKTVTKTTKAPGGVNNLQVAVLVDKNAKMAPADVASLTKTLSSAAGIQKARGDVLTVSQVPFAKQPAAAKPAGLPIPPAFAGILKGVGIGFGALLFLFFVTRHLRRREREALADEPSWLRALEAQKPGL
jgi:flagellar M-ring protein FliF